MDKVLLNRDDVERLFKWRDEHTSLVRSMPTPMKSIELVILTPLRLKLKCIREGAKLTMHVFSEKMKHGKLEFLCAAGMVVCKKNTVANSVKTMSRDHLNSILSIYASLMAYMVYEKPVMEPRERKSVAQRPHSSRQSHQKSKGVTYIVHWTKSRPQTKSGGHHASPTGIFSVRGHYRHYKSGKVVWINEFRKGEGKKKSKIYKLGGGKDGQGHRT